MAHASSPALLMIAVKFLVTVSASLVTDSPSANQVPGLEYNVSAAPATADMVGPKSSMPSSGRLDHRRPIWGLAHMVNSIKELEYRLKSGANGIEADVTFSKDGEPMYTYHGPPCDCWRHCHQQENFEDYLEFIREVAIDGAHEELGQQLTMLFLDLKLESLEQPAKERAGQELAKSIVKILYPAGGRQQVADPFRLVVSINHINDVDLVRNFIHTLEANNASHLLADHIGFDVGMNDDIQLIELMWRRLARNGASLNLWQGDGYTNCLSPFYNLERLSRALAKRDEPQGYPAKVYHWTIDLHDRIRESLLMGVDAIMTNHPERLLTVLKEPMIAHDLRLATRADNPFRKLTRRSAGRSNETARYQRSAYNPSGGFLYSVIDVLASWLNYLREIPILSYPTTLVSRSSPYSRQRLNSNKPTSMKTTSATAVNSSSLINVTKVALQSEPVYGLVATNTTEGGTDQERQPAGPDSAGGPAEAPIDYEGPKWYTSLVSNVLVSIMKVLMPVS